MKPSTKPAPLAMQLIVVSIFIALLMPLVGSKFVTQQISKEQRLILQWYGPVRGTMINSNADAWFRAWAVNTRLMRQTIHKFDPKPTDSDSQAAATHASAVKPLVIRDSSGRFGALPSGSSDSDPTKPSFWYRWITAVFALGYFAMLRLATLAAWLPMLVPICISILVTGYARQQLKWHGFGGVNPREYRAGARLSTWFLGIAVGMLVVPGALPPVTVPICLILMSLGVALLVANGQKPS